VTVLSVESNIILCALAPKKFLYLFKTNIIFNFMTFVATKKVRQLIFSPSSYVVVVVGFEIRDKNQDPG
jgi:hypothetical protein